MLRRRQLKALALAAGSALAIAGMAAIPPSAQAADCTVTVVLQSGQALYFQLPPGAAVRADPFGNLVVARNR